MKKAIVILLIASFIFVAGCIGQETQGNVNDRFVRYAELSASTDNYQIDYDTDYKITGRGETIDLNGEMSINKQGEDSYIYYTFEDPTTLSTIETHIYVINNIAYSCIWESGSEDRRCLKTSQVPSDLAPDPEQEREQVKALLDEGIVSLQSGLKKNIAGHQCDEIIINYNIEKVQEKMSGQPAASSISYMKQSQCYEPESGVPLTMSMTIKLAEEGEAVETVLTTTATSFSRVNSVIRLPDDVEVVDQSTLFQNFNYTDGEYS